jgi:alpha-ketoglutarate-dependent taurine dioxygenase
MDGVGHRPVARKRVIVSRESLVSIGSLPDSEGFPALVQPAMSGVDLAQWCATNTDFLSELLLTRAAILFRGFGIAEALSFRDVVAATRDKLLEYRERAAPRTELHKSVYTSTEFPRDQYIPLHHEMSYSPNWPERIWFCCVHPSASGGCTPIVNDRKVLPCLAAPIRERFERSGVMYVRNYGQGADLSWQEAFQTTERSAVEEYCSQASMTWEWRSGDRLRTRYNGPALVEHPRTGEAVWFNHAHMFHSSNLPPHVHAEMVAQFTEDELPRNVFFGDGSPIEAAMLAAIREIYDASAIRFKWQRGDVLLLDNVLASHGRDPFEGDRSILVAMSGSAHNALPR